MFNLGEISMKKSLVALAALAATGAFAQSAVTMYGVAEATIDLGYKSTASQTVNTFSGTGVFAPGPIYSTTQSTKDAFRVQDGASQGVGTSRIGWRGTEDLGAGMKANFQFEMGIRIDDGDTGAGLGGNGGGSGGSGGNALFGRNAWVGASGGFGEVRLGRQVLGSFGVQGNSWADGAASGLYAPGSAVSPAMGGVRFSNAIKYISPNLGGFTGQVALRAPEGNAETSSAALNPTTTKTNNKTGFDLALEYANGPIYVGFGLNKTKNDTVRNSALGAATNVITSGGASTVNLPAIPVLPFTGVSAVTGTTIGASYNFGVVQPFFNHSRQKSDVNESVQNITPPSLFATSGSIKQKATTLGLKAPFGPVTLITSYGFGKINADTTDTATVAGRVATDSAVVKLKALNIGAQYALSKRTLLEANYGQVKTNHTYNGTNFTPVTGVSLGGVQVNYSGKVSALNVGVRHTF
jgi:predicted porin